MCSISRDSELGKAVVAEIEKKIAAGKPFSGYGINEKVRRCEGGDGLPRPGFSPNGVSQLVRELFNSHDPIFAGYACYPIPGGGPLMYFPVPQEVVAKARKWGFPSA